MCQSICLSFGAYIRYTTPYMPRSDRQVERANRTIQQLLKVYCEEQSHVWDQYIWWIMQAYGSTMQTSTGCTPFMLMHSRCENPDLPLDLLQRAAVQTCFIKIASVPPRNVARIKGYGRDSWVHASSLKPVVRTLDGQLL